MKNRTYHNMKEKNVSVYSIIQHLIRTMLS